jgi:GMP synthase (glutamine-hydrolysing)
MKLLIVDNTEKKDKSLKFNRPLIEAVSRVADYEVANYTKVDQNYIAMRQIDGVVLSGVPVFYPANVINERANRLEWLKHFSLPVLGVCLGHQSIGKVFGSSVLEDIESEFGEASIQLQPPVVPDPIFNGISGHNLEVQVLHRCAITLPANFTQLASSDKCPNQIMRHNRLPIYGIQFHPEHSPTGITLLGNFANVVATYHQESRSVSSLELSEA